MRCALSCVCLCLCLCLCLSALIPLHRDYVRISLHQSHYDDDKVLTCDLIEKNFYFYLYLYDYKVLYIQYFTYCMYI
jgi:hypothetical protein